MEYTQWKKMGLSGGMTPVQEMKKLQKALDVKQRLFIKRDDLTRMGLGGNKNRKLEYVIKEALDQGSDTLITWGGAQSNHCRQTLAYAAHLGLGCYLVLQGRDGGENYQGNELLFRIMGANVIYDSNDAGCEMRCLELEKQLKTEGKKPYYIPLGASTPLGALGYVECAHEIAEQEQELGVCFDAIFLASGSGGTQAGLEVGTRLYLHDCPVYGISVSSSAAEQQKRVGQLSRDLTGLMGLSRMGISDAEIRIHDQFIGEGYAIPTSGGTEAVYWLGKHEGVLLDPVYTAKAMDGMITLLKKGCLEKNQHVLFLHTGGFPALFYYNNCFS